MLAPPVSRTDKSWFPRTRQATRRALGFVLSLGLLGWVLWRADLGELPAVLASLEVRWLPLVVAARLGALVIKAVRWRVLVRAALGTAPAHVIRAALIGALGNVALPLRAGEAVRIALCRRHNEIAVSAIAATVAIDRALDLGALLGLIALGATRMPLPPGVGAAVSGAAGVLAVTVVALTGSRRLAATWAARAPAPVRGVLETFAAGLGKAGRPQVVQAAALLGAVAWLLDSLANWALLHAFAIPVPLTVAMLLTGVVAIGVGIPGAPAGIGPHQFACVVLLGSLGIAAADALALSITSLGITVSVIAAVGALALWSEGLSPHAARVLGRSEAAGTPDQ